MTEMPPWRHVTDEEENALLLLHDEVRKKKSLIDLNLLAGWQSDGNTSIDVSASEHTDTLHTTKCVFTPFGIAVKTNEAAEQCIICPNNEHYGSAKANYPLLAEICYGLLWTADPITARTSSTTTRRLGATRRPLWRS